MVKQYLTMSRPERRVLAKYLWNRGYWDATLAAHKAGLPERTMRFWFARLREGEDLEDKPRLGRPPVRTSTLRRLLAQIKR